MEFDAAKRNERFGCMQCQRSKESSSKGKRRLFVSRRTVGVKVEGKVIPTSFLKIEGRRAFFGEKEGWLVELVGNQDPDAEPPPRSKKGRGSKGDVR